MNIFSSLEHSLHVPWVVSSVLFAVTLLLVAGLSVRRALSGVDAGVMPEAGLSVRNVIEVVVEYLCGLGQMTMGDEYRRYFPVVGTIFLFVLISNLMSLVPGLAGSTGDINTTAAWAIISFVVYNWVGITTHGWKYIYQFMGPSLFELELGGHHYHVRMLAPVFLVLEIPLHLARIATLAIRLLANMFADHTVVLAWIGLVPIGIPAIFMGLGILVSVLQAFVFALLTMIYIGQAMEEAH
jgi:F-type H+-transporting ATPase subunit a